VDLKRTLEDGISEIVAFLPNLIAFLVILLIGFVVAKVVAGIVRKLLEKVGVDDHVRSSDAHKYVERVIPGASVANGVGRVVFWLIFIFFLFTAIGALKVPALTGFMNDVLAYLPNVLVAIAIFVIAALLSGAVAGGVAKVMGDTPTGKIVAAVVPAVVMVIAMFMILEQLQIAPEIVRIAFAAVMGALALGLALAFGLGGRGVAERLLEDAYRNGQEAKRQARQDLEQGRARAEDHVGSGSASTGTTTGATTGTTPGTTTATSFSTRSLGDDPR
jgi:small-conductance mechanosensitive channel